MPKSKKARRNYTTDQKVAIRRRHLVDKVPISELCNEMSLPPSVFYLWQKQVFDNLASALVTPAAANETNKREKELTQKVSLLNARLAKKDSVIAEISAEYVQLKKELGEP